MRIVRLAVLVLAIALVPLAQALAQTCAGYSSFANGNMRLGGDFSSFDGGKSYGVHGAMGQPKSFFGILRVGQSSIDGDDDKTTEFGGTIGYQVPLGDSPAEFCPAGTAGYSTFSGGHATMWGFGGGLGWRAKTSGEMELVPAVGVNYSSISVTIKSGGLSGTASDTFTDLWANLGIVFNKNWTLVPGISKSTESGSKMVMNVSLTYSWNK